MSNPLRQRKKPENLFPFHLFPERGRSINPTATFRQNIRLFLQRCAQREDYRIEGIMPVWSNLLVCSSGVGVPLYIIQEEPENSANPFCDHCRLTGWGNHLVSKRKYHLVIPSDRSWNKPLEDGVLNIDSHALHGLIHCNGFGHLLRINGIEGGSRFLGGREIMDLWDRLCEILKARKISLEDVSKKQGMDLRLLHGVAYGHGHTWFGRWGYKFCPRSYGGADVECQRAIEMLSSQKLDDIVEDFCDGDQYGQIKGMVQHYRVLSESQLVTIGDLFNFMLTFKFRCSLQEKLVTATLSKDMVYLYNNFLLNYPEAHPLEGAAKTILDRKCFVKALELTDESKEVLSLLCQVSPRVFAAENLAAAELAIVPSLATISELKQEVQNALRDTYCILNKFEVTTVDNKGLCEKEDAYILSGELQSGTEILVSGTGIDSSSMLRHERGLDNGDLNNSKECNDFSDLFLDFNFLKQSGAEAVTLEEVAQLGPYLEMDLENNNGTAEGKGFNCICGGEVLENMVHVQCALCFELHHTACHDIGETPFQCPKCKTKLRL